MASWLSVRRQQWPAAAAAAAIDRSRTSPPLPPSLQPRTHSSSLFLFLFPLITCFSKNNALSCSNTAGADTRRQMNKKNFWFKVYPTYRSPGGRGWALLFFPQPCTNGGGGGGVTRKKSWKTDIPPTPPGARCDRCALSAESSDAADQSGDDGRDSFPSKGVFFSGAGGRCFAFV